MRVAILDDYFDAVHTLDCFGVLAPYGEEGHRSLYLSLFGRDLQSGESASALSRLVIGRGISDGKAVSIYEDFMKEQK